MAVIVFFIFVFVWYFPVWHRQGKEESLPRFTIAKSVFMGLIPGFLLIILLQIGLGYLFRALPLSDTAFTACDCYIGAAVVEEFVKFLMAYVVIRKVQPDRKVDYVLIFGAVGLGYEVTETLLLLDSVIAGIGRGIFALHIIWQFFMGAYFYKYREAKQNGNETQARRSLLLAFGVPVFIHGTNDFLAFMAEKYLGVLDAGSLENFSAEAQNITPELEAAGWWTAALLIFMLFEIIFQIITFRMALRAAKESL